jgi:poly(hydroxyalkanoate) granule-associated protein
MHVLDFWMLERSMFFFERRVIMAGKFKKAAAAPGGEQLAKQVMESAQKIWLAGLGAFTNSQGGKVFESLVKQGQEIEKKTRAMAGKAMESAKAQAADTVSMAAGKWDKLEQVFEARVQRSLQRLGVLTSSDIDKLSRQVAELTQTVRSLIAAEKHTGARSAKNTPAKTKATAKKSTKTTAKRTVSRKPRAA